jgi:hypothetical protein
MSIAPGKVKLDSKPKKGVLTLAFFTLLEFVLTVVLAISLAANALFPERSQGAAGVSKILSYQGRLTDSSGNPLGGSGTNYCFRFSIYDAASGGSKIWPSGTPANNTVTVQNGVFNVGIGEADDLSLLDFSATSTVYLQVEAATFSGTCGTYEALSPRQRVDAGAYARVAADVYGAAIRTSSSTAQIGSRAGSATPILLALDVKNTSDTVGGACSTNGAIWYNSANSKSLVCDNGAIRIVGSLGELAAIGVNASTPISAGTVVFSNSNNVTFGLNGSTVTASAGGGGGGGYSIPDFANLSWRDFITNVTTITALSQLPIFVPFVLPGSLTWNRGAIEVSRSTSGSNLFTMQVGIYTFVNSTQISLLGSLQNTYSGSDTANIAGIRRILWTGMGTGATALTPGPYVLGLYFSASAGTASMNYSLRGGQTVGPVGNILPGANSNITATSQLSSLPLARFLGRYTATTANLPGSVAFSQVQHWTSNYPIYFYLHST